MSIVRTLHGDITPNELGFTYGHEHIKCEPPFWQEKQMDDLLLDDKEKSKREVMDFKKHGGHSIVDATAVDYGRDVPAVADIARETGVSIIGTAGFNKSFLWTARLPAHLQALVGDYETYGQWIENTSIEGLADFVIEEVESGLEGTSYRAGQVKFGTGYNRITPLEEKTIRAVARAHHATKAPVHSHTEAGTMALQQIEILTSEGVPMENVSFGHMDRNLDPYYHEQIAKTGAYLSFDGISKVKYAPDSARSEAILHLVAKGYENHILVSGDTARKSYFKHYDYGLGFENIIANWVPRFVNEANQAGFDGGKLIQKFFVDNPARCMTFKER
ncbi:phosphotriesterase [Thalassobacillus sp. CUG 92003]|uniref:phosphotriesterase family protein n=1 Tax=Thalassobacillus sp. CUG 92003 TaxID=2736641 RepID=UPI0015E775BC|nr:phosphotriesterase [Thalassobacillus sp. CUG 92003]